MYEFTPGSTGRSIHAMMRSTSDGQAKLGLTAASSGASVSYVRSGGTSASIPLVDLGAADAAWQAGGWVALNANGEYRLCLPDAALAAGAPFLTVNLKFDQTFTEAVLVLLRNPTNNVGAGAISFTVNVQDGSSQPLAGASVWVSTDVGGNNVVAGAIPTSALGQATFLLDAGTYYLWCADDGFTGTNPTTIVVS
jgi:hypothetical protein